MEEKVKSLSEKLIALILSCTKELFHTDEQEPFITLSNCLEMTWSLMSSDFMHYAAGEFFKAERKSIGKQEMQAALTVLKAKALYEGPAKPVFVRMAQHNGNIYLDLANDRWEAIEITSNGWRVVETPPVKFNRTRGLRPLPTPVAGGDIEELRSIVNVTSDDEWVLLVSWLIGALNPVGPFSVLVLEGTHGTAKSFSTRVLRSLIDPCSTPLRCEPSNARDLMIAAKNGRIVALDNLSGIPPWLSDALCRLSTGGGLATRQLYTDSEEALFNACRPIILNGINVGATRGDLLDRAMILTLSPIDDESRVTESELLEKFNSIAPRVLGALLDGVSLALRRMPTLDMQRLPRMADFAKWVTGAEVAFGWPEGTFLNVYGRHQEELNEMVLESSPLVEPIKALCEKGEWEGTATKLLEALVLEARRETAGEPRGLPKTANGLSRALRRLGPHLQKIGISAEKKKTPGSQSKKLWRIAAVEASVGASVASIND